ncbi:MAG: histidine phosphatase family protein [Pseudomonadales bacterium]|nr:histidine phosphatase family protein [Pseudomonadales bacterium]
MARIYMIRHGKAAASFTDDLDPGLDEQGRQQAVASCQQLETHLPLILKSSPLKRAQETAIPLAETTGQAVIIENRVAEVPSPGMSLEERGPWLREVMSGKWSEQSADLQQWKADLVQCLLETREDTAFFSHYVAINTAVSAATGDDQVLVCRPDNGSITVFETDGETLTLVSLGDEASTVVN